jgi:translation initiation factor IF-1
MKNALVGVVREQLPSALYRVEVDGAHQVVAHLAEPLRRNFIRLLVGDRVRVELSPADAGRGRITERLTS